MTTRSKCETPTHGHASKPSIEGHAGWLAAGRLGWVGSVLVHGDKLLSTDQLCGQGNQSLVHSLTWVSKRPDMGRLCMTLRGCLIGERAKASLIQNSFPRSMLCMAWGGWAIGSGTLPFEACLAASTASKLRSTRWDVGTRAPKHALKTRSTRPAMSHGTEGPGSCGSCHRCCVASPSLSSGLEEGMACMGVVSRTKTAKLVSSPKLPHQGILAGVSFAKICGMWVSMQHLRWASKHRTERGPRGTRLTVYGRSATADQRRASRSHL
jgi:hypothetical protein